MHRLGLILACLTLVACGERDYRMVELSNPNDGPEEFAIEPVRPLESPVSYSDLPPPTPGGANRTDLTPKADAIGLLGGKPARLSGGTIPAGDGAIVAHATRYGVPSDIRKTLAAEDLDFRRRKSRFTKIRIVKVDRYNEAYRRMALDPHAELRRFRQAGVATPSAPPQE